MAVNPISDRASSDDGYRLWLRYEAVTEPRSLAEYEPLLRAIHFPRVSETLVAAAWELEHAFSEMFGVTPDFSHPSDDSSLLVGTPHTNSEISARASALGLQELGQEGYVLREETLPRGARYVLAASSDIGVLYGVFALLKHLQTRRPLGGLDIRETPALAFRMLNHWDNLDRTIERGYAGFSLWDWHKLPAYMSSRYTDYARANASVGINAVALTNVNANARVLTAPYLDKVRALADVFRPYGIRVFLTARFNAPSELDQLETSDPLDRRVIAWWHAKVAEIYAAIFDFGGIVVKANSEGQPGPQDYGRTQADGANLLASALEPYGGIVVWRAFVYRDTDSEDRHKQAYDELVPLDGSFKRNACLQVKNGPIDFQPREPFHPLFGAMPKTPLFLEFQLTQEYLGFATHLVYLAPLFKETLDADTYAKGPGSSVAAVISGTLDQHPLTGMAGVSNIGDERNWCGHPFAAANWYAFARLAWNPEQGAAELAEEWLRMTFSNDSAFLKATTDLMLASREAAVDYMTPLGLHHLMARSHHYGPGPWVTGGERADWTATYYHQADVDGVGFDRTKTGSNALAQYQKEVRLSYEDPHSCPERLLLWFHHVDWDTRLRSGRTLWEELCHAYTRGVASVRHMRTTWLTLSQSVDPGRFAQVLGLLDVQLQEAEWWRNACLLYFQSVCKRPFPAEIEPPRGSLDEYIERQDYYVPGI